MTKVSTGADILSRENFSRLEGLNLAILANQSATNSSLEHIFASIKKNPKCKVKKLFAPEHGFFGTKQDMETVGQEKNANLEIISLYGDSEDKLHPNLEHFLGIDALIVDLPDIGARYYTFAQTMAYCMQVCAQSNTKVIVLDRPNPINGVDVCGTTLEPDCRSFCGYGPIPQRHGFTLGELAEVFNRGLKIDSKEITAIDCDLEVIKMQSWSREMYFDQTGVPWVIPSVNMPTLDTAIVYPGMCLFEATMLSEGRGTTKPFEFVGAPYIDGADWIEEVSKSVLNLDGATLRPIQFIPKFQKCADQECGGVQIHVDSREKFCSFRWAIALLAAAKSLYPRDFKWRSGSYEFISKIPAIDLLYGSSSLREVLENGSGLGLIENEISDFSKKFREIRKPFLLY